MQARCSVASWGAKESHEGDAIERGGDEKREDGGTVRKQGAVRGRNNCN